jgi:glycosyltransferase involved in cell wall biosynthesis
MTPFASIIIPTRNRPELLSRALASLVAQTEPSWEALVVDDGDGSGVVVATAYADARIRATLNPGGGQVAARNAAIATARGQVICWLDDDDWWHDPHHLAVLREAAAEGPAVWFRGGWLVACDGAREVGREPFEWDATPGSLRANNTILTSSIAYPRAAQVDVGPLDEELGGYCDWDILLRLVDHGLPLRRLPGQGVCYAVHSGGGSADPAVPDRAARFARLSAKHGLAAVIANHATMHEALVSTGGGPASGSA